MLCNATGFWRTFNGFHYDDYFDTPGLGIKFFSISSGAAPQRGGGGGLDFFTTHELLGFIVIRVSLDIRASIEL